MDILWLDEESDALFSNAMSHHLKLNFMMKAKDEGFRL
jgi:hypothetical protein